MTINIENIGINKIKITFTATEELVNEYINKALKKKINSLSLPGFRKGKVPVQFFRKKFGVESVYSEAIDSLINKMYTDAVKEKHFSPVGNPELAMEEDDANTISVFSENKPFTFNIDVVVRPTPILGQYKDIEVKEIDTNVTDEDIEKNINELLEKNSTWTISEETAQLENKILIDVERLVSDNDENISCINNLEVILNENIEQDDLPISIRLFIDNFLGKKAGDIAQFEFPFKMDDNDDIDYNENDSTESYNYNFILIEVMKKEKPVLSDAFAHEFNNSLNTVEELKQHIKDTLVKQRTASENERLRTEVIKKVIENTEVDVPEEMIKREQEFLIQKFEHQFKMYGISAEALYNMPNFDKEKIWQESYDQAKENILYELVLTSIAKKENIHIDDVDIQKSIAELAQTQNISLQEAKKNFNYMDKNKREQVVLLQKTVDFLITNCKQVKSEDNDKLGMKELPEE